MSALVSAEILKLRTTRTGLALIGAVLGFVVLISFVAALTGKPPHTAHDTLDALSIATFAQPFALVLGILAVTTEFRHGTITPTLIVAPDKVRLVLAKLAAHVIAGLVLAVLATGLCVAIILVLVSGRGGAVPASTDVVNVAIGQVVACALWAALGVGLGALLRNQAGAIVGALAWTFVVEHLLGILPAGIGDAIQKYGTNGATGSLASTPRGPGDDRLSQLDGGLLLALYALIFVVLGILAMRRRDVTQ